MSDKRELSKKTRYDLQYAKEKIKQGIRQRMERDNISQAQEEQP